MFLAVVAALIGFFLMVQFFVIGEGLIGFVTLAATAVNVVILAALSRTIRVLLHVERRTRQVAPEPPDNA